MSSSKHFQVAIDPGEKYFLFSQSALDELIDNHVKAEREACANINRAKAMRLEKEVQEAVKESDIDSAVSLRASAWLIFVCEAEIRARGQQ